MTHVNCRGVNIWKPTALILWAVMVLLASWNTSFAQGSIQHQPPTLIERGQSVDLSFTLPGISPDMIEDANFYYNYEGQISYKQVPLRTSTQDQQTYIAELPVFDTEINEVFYYVRFSLTNGQTVTYPGSRPEMEPATITVVDPREDQTATQTDSVEGKVGEVEYTILSPEPGTEMVIDEALIALTFFYEDTPVPADSFKIVVNGKDVTAEAEIDPYFLSYIPEEMPEGETDVKISYQSESGTVELTNWSFKAVESLAASAQDVTLGNENIPIQGEVEFTARNQVIGGNTNDAIRGNLRLSGRQGPVRYSINGRLTSQEDPRLQPQNRYGAELLIGKWFEARAGHIYPTLSPMSIAGRRVLGVESELHLLWQNLNFEFVYGSLTRDIPNLYNNVGVEIDTLTQSLSGQVITDTSYTLNFDNNGRGSFDRQIIGGRFAIGNREYAQLGFHAIKVEDDTSSISNIGDFDELISFNPDLTGSLNQEQYNYLLNNPDELDVEAANPQPKGNIVIGSDFRLNLHDSRIRLNAMASASMLNDDISGGPLDQARAEDLGFDIDQDITDLLTEYSWIIIVNEQMNVLPFKFEEQDDGTSELSPFVPYSIFAGRGNLSLNYFNNNLKVNYQWIGPDYNSLANSTIRKDVAGFGVTDRIRMFRNRIYLTLGYEQLYDNVLDSRESTTSTDTYRTGISWYPINQNLPRVRVSGRYRLRDNDVDRRNPYLNADLIRSSVRNVANDSSTVLPNPKMTTNILLSTSISQQFDLLGITHDASLNFSLQNAMNDVFAYGDTKSQTYSFNITNRFNNFPLNTNFGFSYNTTESLSGLSDIEIWGGNIGATVFLLDNKLQVNGNAAVTRNISTSTPLTVIDPFDPAYNLNTYNMVQPPETEGYLNDVYVPNTSEKSTRRSLSYIFRGSAQYNLNQYHSFAVDANFNNVVSTGSSVNIPNDRILQARYIFRF